jgi:hypothetical protein
MPAGWSATASLATAWCFRHSRNPQTTALKQSPIGKPLTTLQLQAKLPVGFGSTGGITPGVSFPYLKLAGLDFWAPLAITTVGTNLFTFLPISQREKSEYSKAVAHADRAGLAFALQLSPARSRHPLPES